MGFNPNPQTTLDAALLGTETAALGRVLPVSLAPNGTPVNFKSSADGHPLVEISDPSSAFGEILVAQPLPMARASFEQNQMSPHAFAEGNGNVSFATSMAQLRTTAATSRNHYIETYRAVPYQLGQGSEFRFTGRFVGGVAGSQLIYGALTDANGFAFGYNGDQFGILHRQNSVDTWIPQPDWDVPLNGSGYSSMVLNPSKHNVYVISMQHLGTGGILFSIEDQETRILTPVHLLPRVNLYEVPTIYQSQLPLRAQVINTTNATSVGIDLICMAGFVQGKLEPLGKRRFSAFSKGSIGTTSIPVISLKNPRTGPGNFATHRLPLYLQEINGASSGNQAGVIEVWRNRSLTAASFASVDATQTQAQVDTSATAFAASDGTLLFSAPTGSNVGNPVRKTYDLQEVMMHIGSATSPDDVITVAARTFSATSTFQCGIGWIDGAG